jgi:hypothetical protein
MDAATETLLQENREAATETRTDGSERRAAHSAHTPRGRLPSLKELYHTLVLKVKAEGEEGRGAYRAHSNGGDGDRPEREK